MNKPVHTMTIDPQGRCTIQVDGMKGTACRDATKAVEDALGKVKETDPTADYFRFPDLKVTA